MQSREPIRAPHAKVLMYGFEVRNERGRVLVMTAARIHGGYLPIDVGWGTPTGGARRPGSSPGTTWGQT